MFLLISERWRGRYRNINEERDSLAGYLLPAPLSHSGAHNPGMCPDQEPNRDLLVHRSTLNRGARLAGPYLSITYLLPLEGSLRLLPARDSPALLSPRWRDGAEQSSQDGKASPSAGRLLATWSTLLPTEMASDHGWPCRQESAAPDLWSLGLFPPWEGDPLLYGLSSP
uniref:Uncharacterized protein n=1 Tax=Pipistrellus kuhlii TaxID=59472 RepID=A0A7J8B208_PIPKU|nr:hypothetical protein mPipKuh1_007752 [Pipistrellus kuhlii]